MAKFDKPANLNTIWASTALSQNSVYPSTSYAQEGWLQVKPPLEYENAINYKHDQMLAHINQLGIVEWDSNTEYQAGKSYVQGSNNLLYKCVQTNVNKNPATAGNESFWEVFEGNRQATTSARGTSKLATNNQLSVLTSNNVAVTPESILQGLLGSAVLESNGHVKFPFNHNGVRRDFIIQWGGDSVSTSTDGLGSVAFTQSFPNRVLFAILTDDAVTPESTYLLSWDVSKTTKDRLHYVRNGIGSAPSLAGFRFLAIGY